MEKEDSIFKQFAPYPSIELHSNAKYIKKVYKSQLNSPDVLWIATEKIHGANFSICYDFDKQIVKYGRRQDFLTQEIPIPVDNVKRYFNQNFFDAADLVNTFHNKLVSVKEKVNKNYQNVKGIQIYGEYFGGFWPGEIECRKRVQSGVYYTPNHQYMVFDIKLIYQDKFQWVDITEIPNILEQNLKYVPIYKKGTIEELIELNTEIDSTICELLKLEKLQNNICQGFIIRPNTNFIADFRVVLKKKNKQFYEKTKQKAPAQYKPEKKMDKNQFVEELLLYLNENRVESAISKFPDFKNKNHLKQMVVTDIFEDAKKQGYKDSQDPIIIGQTKKQLNIFAIKFIQKYLAKNKKE